MDSLSRDMLTISYARMFCCCILTKGLAVLGQVAFLLSFNRLVFCLYHNSIFLIVKNLTIFMVFPMDCVKYRSV